MLFNLTQVIAVDAYFDKRLAADWEESKTWNVRIELTG